MKCIGGLMLVLLLVAIVPAVLAEEPVADQVTADDEQQLAVFDLTVGSELRMLQLEKAITRNLIIGEETVKYLQEKDTAVDVSGLDAILDDMDALLKEVQSAQTPATREELAKQFIDFKKDSIALTKEFVDAVKPLLAEGDREVIRDRVKDLDTTVLKDIHVQIRSKRQELNSLRVQNILGNWGISDPALVAKVQSGEATIGEVRSEMRRHFSTLSNVMKRGIVEGARERVAKVAVMQRAFAEKARTGFAERHLQRRAERLDTRSDRVGQRADRADGLGLDRRADLLDKRSDNLDARGGRMGDLADRAGDNTGGIRDRAGRR